MAKVKIAVGRRRETENTVGKGPGHVLKLQTGMIERGRERAGRRGPTSRPIAMIRHEPSVFRLCKQNSPMDRTLPRIPLISDLTFARKRNSSTNLQTFSPDIRHMAVTLDGPRLAAKSTAPEQLVVFLHGYGANGNDLIAIGKQWRNLMPDAAFVAPNAPEPCGQVPGGRQWFRLTMRDPDERWTGVNKAAPVLDAFLDAELDRYGLDDSKLALVGFSQGTMLALHAGLRRPRAPAWYPRLFGRTCHCRDQKIRPSRLSPPATSRPFFSSMAARTTLFRPKRCSFRRASWNGQEFRVSGIFRCGLGHGIDGEGLLHGGLFLAKCFGLKPDPGVLARL